MEIIGALSKSSFSGVGEEFEGSEFERMEGKSLMGKDKIFRRLLSRGIEKWDSS